MELEMFPDDDADPCEVYLSEYHEVDGRMLPGKIEVRYGDGIYQVFSCKQYKFEPAAEKQLPAGEKENAVEKES